MLTYSDVQLISYGYFVYEYTKLAEYTIIILLLT